MSYKTIFGEEFENEFDEKMTHKYGDKYKCVKSVYPDVCKLPESEIQPMTYIARYQGDTVDEAKDLIRKYIKEKEPMWKEMCLIDDNNSLKQNVTGFSEQESDAFARKNQRMFKNMFPQNNNKKAEPQNFSDYNSQPDLGAFQKCYEPLNLDIKSLSFQPELSEFQADMQERKKQYEKENMDNMKLNINRSQFVDDLYNHLKKPIMEGYYNYPYCDSETNPSVGSGLLINSYPWLYDKTMTPYDGAISETNRPYTNAKKKTFWNQYSTFCKEDEIKDMKPSRQLEKYREKYHEDLPYFQHEELENLSKQYIRNEVIPVLEQKMKRLGIDIYEDLAKNGRLAEGEMMYNMGSDRFRLNPEGNSKKDWKYHARALQKRDAKEAARQSHRYQVSVDRNKDTYEKLLNAFQPDYLKNLDYLYTSY